MAMDRARAAFQHLLARGYSPTAAAGIVGNLVQESSVLPNGARGDGGTAFGLAQWRGDRQTALRNFAASRGLDVNSTPTQLDFLDEELRTKYGKGYQAVINAPNAQEAAGAFALHYERPKGAETGDWRNIHGIQNRVDWANRLAGQTGAPMTLPSVAAGAPDTSGVGPQAFGMNGGGTKTMPSFTPEGAPPAPAGGQDSISQMLAGLASQVSKGFGGSGQMAAAQPDPQPQSNTFAEKELGRTMSDMFSPSQGAERLTPQAPASQPGQGMLQTLPYSTPQVGMDPQTLLQQGPYRPRPGTNPSDFLKLL